MFRICNAVFFCTIICLSSSLGQKRLPKDCDRAGVDGIAKIKIKSPLLPLPIFVDCESTRRWMPTIRNTRWIIILRRDLGTANFNRSWNDYKYGFGDMGADLFMGLDRIHAITTSKDHELWVQLEDENGKKRAVLYDKFVIGSEEEQYAITALGNYSGTAGDSLRYHMGSKFSTYDNDNDASQANCAQLYSSGWWFKSCIRCNLNGLLKHGRYTAKFADGVVWKDWHGLNYSYKYAHMAIRAKRDSIY